MSDPFAEAARAEGERRYIKSDPDYPDREAAIARTAAFAIGAAWARDHIAAQEPTREEVEAAARSLAEDDGLDWCASATPTGVYRSYARAALSAARAARRDEEKR